MYWGGTMVQRVSDGNNVLMIVLEAMGFNQTQWPSLTKLIKMAKIDYSTFNYYILNVWHKQLCNLILNYHN